MKLNRTLILWGVAGFLILAYILSFAFVQKTDKRKSFKTAYVNAKYKNEINKFKLTKNDESIFLTKQDGIWYVQQNGKNDFIPASQERVQKFIAELIKVRNMYKITDSIQGQNSYIFTLDDAFCIKYQTSLENFPELLFGKMDFAQISRYFMTGKAATVYETDTAIDVFSSVSVQNWSEPYIVSRSLIGNLTAKDVQSVSVSYGNQKKTHNSSSENFYDICTKFLDLRHGGIFYEENAEGASSDELNVSSNAHSTSDEPLFINLEFGNKSSAEFLIEQKGEGVYKVHCVYKFDRKKSQISYNVKISSWTYNKIKEIML
ncbi:MAG: hypothetical protein K6A43_11265 [Treponema sp.]|nr:hypothetical protein [Treponema sp.]